MATLEVSGAISAESRISTQIIFQDAGTGVMSSLFEGVAYVVGYPESTFEIIQTYAVAGSVTAEATVASTFTFTPKYIISGAVDAEATIAATFGGGRVVLGDAEAKAIVAAAIVATYAATGTSSSAITNLDAIVLNTETLARSHYANFAFDSLISYKGNIYGTLGGVVYQLTGTTDAGAAIATTVRTGQSDFNVVQKKNIPDVYVNMETAGAVTVKSVTDNATESSAQTIAAYSGVTGIAPRRAKMPLGRMSRMWGVEIANVSGAASEIESIHMTPDQIEKEI